MRINIAAIVLLVLVAQIAVASDLAREQRMADEIVDSIIDGDAVYLKSGNHEFLNIYTQADTEKVEGAVIILHGRGYHPNWSEVVRPLRVGLIESGWNTLSMQMPVLDKTASFYDYVPILNESFPRIEAGIEYLKQKGNNRIVLIAHSCSVHMAMVWVDAGRFGDVDAFVGIGMGATDYKQPMAKPFSLEKIKVPVLDIFGSNEYPAVLRGAAERKKAILKADNKKSKQLSVLDADHYFTDQGDALLEVISEWLSAL